MEDQLRTTHCPPSPHRRPQRPDARGAARSHPQELSAGQPRRRRDHPLFRPGAPAPVWRPARPTPPRAHHRSHRRSERHKLELHPHTCAPRGRRSPGYISCPRTEQRTEAPPGASAIHSPRIGTCTLVHTEQAAAHPAEAPASLCPQKGRQPREQQSLCTDQDRRLENQ